MKLNNLLFLLISTQLIASCNPKTNEPVEEIRELSVNFDVKTALAFDGDKKIYLRVGGKTVTSTKSDRLVNRDKIKGLGAFFWVSKDEGLVATACVAPNLVGFTHIDLQASNEIYETINLVKAVKIDINVLSPTNNTYTVSESELVEDTKLSLSIDGIKQEKLIICSVEYSYFPQLDYYKHFNLNNGVLIMKPHIKNLLSIDFFTQFPDIDHTDILVMGLVELEGEFVGFSAKTRLDIIRR